MRTTIELPDELLARAKSRAALSHMSLKEFFIQAVEQKLAPAALKKVRHAPNVISTGGPPIPDLTPHQIEEALFGPIDEFLPGGR
jgi:hypothetical protein